LRLSMLGHITPHSRNEGPGIQPLHLRPAPDSGASPQRATRHPMNILIHKTIRFVRQTLEGAEGGHDWWHTWRVWQLAKQINQFEKADPLTVELSALLHDIADAKFHNGDERIGVLKARNCLESLAVDPKIIHAVTQIIRHISFRDSFAEPVFDSPEFRVVQDADRLDALGAIGIARAFSYGGYKHRPLYDPEIKPRRQLTRADYLQASPPTINHFYEKLLHLKDRMQTATGKQFARQRHHFLEAFLDEFFEEWHGKK